METDTPLIRYRTTRLYLLWLSGFAPATALGADKHVVAIR
jgi:hypothetical protein